MLDLNRLMKTVRPAEDTDELVDGPQDDTIEFMCHTEDYDVIPEPEPASNVMPDWYKDLNMTNGDGHNPISGPTVRRCGPFLDALSMGWMLKVPATIEFNSADPPENRVSYNWQYNRELVSKHAMAQLGGDDFPGDGVPLKFHSLWYPKVPDGYSLMVVPPLNRPDSRFRAFSGVVDFDGGYYHPLNVPFLWLDDDFRGTVEVGTPFAQVIPIKRDALIEQAEARPMTQDEHLQQKRTQNRDMSEVGYYRQNEWDPKSTRMVNSEE